VGQKAAPTYNQLLMLVSVTLLANVCTLFLIVQWLQHTRLHCGVGVIKGGKMELPLHMLPLCCHSLTTGYFHHIVVLSGLFKLPKPKLGISARYV
jgi:hypothetical protein